jgi:Cys-tRNA(Pro)/Cys-tRNA(Cys) deacylase
MGKKQAPPTPAIAALIATGITHDVVSYEHDPAVESYGEEAAHALGLPPGQIFKTLMTEVDTAPVCAIVPVTATLSLKSLASAHGGKRAQMMDPVRAQRLSGYVLGGISPLGQKTAVPTYVDSSAEHWERVYVSAGRRGLEVSLAPTDLARATQGRFAPLVHGRE